MLEAPGPRALDRKVLRPVRTVSRTRALVTPPTSGNHRDRTGRTWPGLSAQPARRGRHVARDARLRLLIAVGLGAGVALVVFGLILAVAG